MACIDVIGSVSRPPYSTGTYIRKSRAFCIADSTLAGKRRSRSLSSRLSRISGPSPRAATTKSVASGGVGFIRSPKIVYGDDALNASTEQSPRIRAPWAQSAYGKIPKDQRYKTAFDAFMLRFRRVE